jgi:hypothetical protein
MIVERGGFGAVVGRSFGCDWISVNSRPFAVQNPFVPRLEVAEPGHYSPNYAFRNEQIYSQSPDATVIVNPLLPGTSKNVPAP